MAIKTKFLIVDQSDPSEAEVQAWLDEGWVIEKMEPFSSVVGSSMPWNSTIPKIAIELRRNV